MLIALVGYSNKQVLGRVRKPDAEDGYPPDDLRERHRAHAWRVAAGVGETMDDWIDCRHI